MMKAHEHGLEGIRNMKIDYKEEGKRKRIANKKTHEHGLHGR